MDCDKFKIEYSMQRIKCCELCHEDDIMGYGDDLWLTVDGKPWNICCNLMRECEKRKIN